MITGFPSPAQGYEDKTIDLNSLIVKHPAATVFMQIDTSRYNRMGIYFGDLLAIDRSLPIHPDSLVVFDSDGEFKLGRVCQQQGEITICGVITHVIHTVKGVTSQ